MNYLELFINNPVNARLDMDQSFDISLQYSLADIRDISKRNAAYSKTIVLPGTKTNNYWFGNLFDVNADFTAFNPNRKTDCKLVVNGETVIDGFLQLRKIRKQNDADHQGSLIQYEVVVFNNAVDLMSSLGEKTINELDLSEYGHTFSFASITQSWTHTYEDGYVYPMYGLANTPANNYYDADNFWPGMFYWTLLDRTLYEAGFGWTGSLKDNELFQKEIISYVSDGRPKISEDERRRREFYVGATGSTFSMGTFSGGIGSTVVQTLGPTAAPYGDEVYPYFDNDNNWNETTYEWELDVNGLFSGEWRLAGSFSLYNGSGATISAVYPPSSGFGLNNTRRIVYQMSAQVKIRRQSGVVVNWPGAGIVNAAPFTYTFVNTVGTQIMSKTFSVAETKTLGSFNLSQVLPALNDSNKLSIGDKVYLLITLRKNGTTGLNNTTSSTYWNGDLRAQLKFNLSSFFENTAITSELTQGDPIDLADYLPDKIKQKDMITDLITRYNLYISVDPDNDRMLIMDTRPDYYLDGSILDWTNKKDYSQEDNIELLSELQFKEMLFTWTQDEDDMNKGYEYATGDIYGQYTYNFDNDFVKGAKEIKSPFSPTPIVYNSNFGAHLPAINPEAPKVKPRILVWGGLRDLVGGSSSVWSMSYQNLTTGALQTAYFPYYPYAGHFDDPVEPTMDNNFWTCKYYFYNNYEYLTNNNMFNVYWSNFVSQIENGRLVTSKFYLDEYDVRFIKENFNTKIFVLDSYYYINRIVDYKPLRNETTTVELIKIVEGVTWEGQFFAVSNGGATAVGPLTPTVVSADVDGPLGPVLGGGPGRPVFPYKEVSFKNALGKNSIALGGGKNSLGGGRYVDIDGTFSYYVPNYQLVFGNQNQLGGNNNLVLFGDDNRVEGDDNMLFNSNDNYIPEEISNSVLFNVTGLTVSSSDTVYFGPSFSINTTTGVVNTSLIYASIGLTYGTSDNPSLTWDDGFDAGLWKNDSSERGFNAGVLGVTISSWTSQSMELNDKYLSNFRFRSTYTQTSPYILTIDDMIVTMSGTATGMTVSLPESPSIGRMYIIKSVNPNSVVVATGTASHVIDEVNTILTLNQYDSVSLVYASTDRWIIV